MGGGGDFPSKQKHNYVDLLFLFLPSTIRFARFIIMCLGSHTASVFSKCTQVVCFTAVEPQTFLAKLSSFHGLVIRPTRTQKRKRMARRCCSETVIILFGPAVRTGFLTTLYVSLSAFTDVRPAGSTANQISSSNGRNLNYSP